MADKPLINLADVPLAHSRHGEPFEARMGSIGALIGSRQLGCRLTVVPPGKRAWPFHCHHANEELFVILDGRGRYRHGAASDPITAGDVIVAPAGGAVTAHQIVNDSDAELRYLAISTMHAPDLMEYPDSGKFGVFAGSAPGGDPSARTFSAFVPRDARADYWDGEI